MPNMNQLSRLFWILPLIAFLLLFVASESLQAQIRTLRGKVMDESDNPIVGAEVEIQRTDVQRSYKTKTDKSGNYIYTGLPFGTYRIVVKKDGFQSDFVQGLQPAIGEDKNYDFVLKRGQAGKLAFEFTPEELERLQKQAAKQEEVKKQSDEVRNLFTQGLEFSSKGQLTEAIDAFMKALEKDPEQPNIWANLGDTYNKAGNLDKATESFQKAIALKPDDASLYQNLGVIHGRAGRMAEAEAAFQKAAQLNPAAAAVNFFNMGATLVNSGKSADAIMAFQKAIEADPNYAEAYYELGICYVGVNRVKDSVEALRKYLTIGKHADHMATARALVEELGKIKP